MLRMEFGDSANGACLADAASLDVYWSDSAVRTLARNELLFEIGDIKANVYRVE